MSEIVASQQLPPGCQQPPPPTDAERSAFLVVDHVSKVFQSNREMVVALQDFSCSVDAGTFVAIVGPSGCGKSTLLRISAGLAQPTSGAVLVKGKKIEGPGPDRGVVFQSYTSFPWLTVRENVEFGLKLRNISEELRREASRRLIAQVGLSGFENAYPETLSGGMKQRVAIARTLANYPDILIMDEPFGALDYQTRWAMQELLLDVWEKEKKTVLFVTHDIEEALFLADAVIVVSQRPGRVKNTLAIPFERPRVSALKANQDFVAMKTEIVNLVRLEMPPEFGGRR